MFSSGNFLQDMDALVDRGWQLWAGSTRILQANQTNPRIRQLSTREANELSIQLDRVMGQVYRVRICKSEELAPLIRADAKYRLSFDNGLTFHDCRCIPPIQDSVEQGAYWVLILEKATNG